jgi:hypothetical protein
LNPTPLNPPRNEILQGNEALIDVKLIWGIDADSSHSTGPWIINSKSKRAGNDRSTGTALLQGLVSGFDLSDPDTQEWMLDVVLAAKRDASLNVKEDEPTWIELFHDFAMKQEGGFPVAKELLMGYIDILKSNNQGFDRLVEDEIGTLLPGLAGETLYASVTIRSYETSSLTTFAKWTSFAEGMNALAPNTMLHIVAQSDLFWSEARATETVDATVNTWLIANGLCCLIILFFTKNFLLSLMVMATILLMFFCIAGWLFAIFDLPLGPVQALGVSIFIGLSANYSLHVVHAYHHSSNDNRESKVKHAVFITGSPICASAFSTIGGCAFLLGCRTLALVELGILICCVTAMALVYSMGFLLVWLLTMGPLPCGEVGENNGRRLHRWDVYALCDALSRNLNTTSTYNEAGKKNKQEDDPEVQNESAGQGSGQPTTVSSETNAVVASEKNQPPDDPDQALSDHAQNHLQGSDSDSESSFDVFYDTTAK